MGTINFELLYARDFLSPLETYYPNFHEWYYYKVVPDVSSGKRRVLTEMTCGEIVAVAILKKYEDEKKICTFRVSKEASGRGLGTKLMRESLDWLECPKPLLTVNEENASEFARFLKKFNFQESRAVNGLYRPNKLEIIYNEESDR